MPLAKAWAGPAVILRNVEELRPVAKYLHDAYRLRTEGKNVFIESASPEGLRNGVYGLLTDHLDANWFQPNSLGEEISIPKDNTVRLPTLHEVRGSPWTSCIGSLARAGFKARPRLAATRRSTDRRSAG